MKKRNILLSLLLIISLAACKVDVKNAEDVMLTKEDYELNVFDSFDGGDNLDYGAGVYSFKGIRPDDLRLTLSTYDNGEITEAFDIELPKIEDTDKLGIAVNSSKIYIYDLSDNKTSVLTHYEFKDKKLNHKMANGWQWDNGGVIKDGEVYPVFASFSNEANSLITPIFHEDDIRDWIKNNKEYSGMILELRLEDRKNSSG